MYNNTFQLISNSDLFSLQMCARLPHFMEHASHLTYVDWGQLDIPQCISPAAAAAVMESRHYKYLQVCTSEASHACMHTKKINK